MAIEWSDETSAWIVEGKAVNTGDILELQGAAAEGWYTVRVQLEDRGRQLDVWTTANGVEFCLRSIARFHWGEPSCGYRLRWPRA